MLCTIVCIPTSGNALTTTWAFFRYLTADTQFIPYFQGVSSVYFKRIGTKYYIYSTILILDQVTFLIMTIKSYLLFLPEQRSQVLEMFCI